MHSHHELSARGDRDLYRDLHAYSFQDGERVGQGDEFAGGYQLWLDLLTWLRERNEREVDRGGGIGFEVCELVWCLLREQYLHRRMSAAKIVTVTFAALPKCVVPKVKGKSLRAAKRAIKMHHCRVGRITHAFSKQVNRGHVISQKPKPHKRLRHGAKVSLVVSKGKP